MSVDQRAKVASVLMNFRCLYTEKGEGGRGLLYRSYRPDFLEGEDLENFNSLGIKSIIDLRSKSDYLSTGAKEIDKDYKLHSVLLPRRGKYQPHEPITVRPTKTDGSKKETQELNNKSRQCNRKHYLINFFTKKFINLIFWRLSWYSCLMFLFIFLYDLCCRNRFKYVARFFGRNVLNVSGLASSYVDMSEMSQHSICAVLKLLTDRSNVPALINCAYGKDRTGIVSAVIMSIMGESDEAIIKDFSKSKESLRSIKHKIEEELSEKYGLNKSFSEAEPVNIELFLDHIKVKYGSMKNYVEYIGFSEAEQDQLRANLGFKGENFENS